MELGNQTPSNFILVGIPGMEESQHWLAFPFCFLYIISIMGNCTILFIIRTERSLHTPMYCLLAMLALIDLGVALTTLPTILSIFCFQAPEININACLAQMFFIHFLPEIESGVLLAMAFDRYIAICKPLRYTAILTNSLIENISLAIFTRGICIVLPLPLLTIRFPFCKSHMLSHSYCLHQDIIRLACADIKVNSVFGMVAVILSWGLDSLFILFSYVMILWAVLKIATKDAQFKALNTCISHICAVLMFYIPLIGISVVHRVRQHHSTLFPTMLANVYLLGPPVVNPIIYSIKTKQIRARILRTFQSHRIHAEGHS
ncbi:olfactory receptor 51G2-like [Pleurodeles waltl]|uniref:olfactory receptor 51G2-like n=1 Tax=Pleurodeles waltl TaxID=8319 RepID=UPI003709851A